MFLSETLTWAGQLTFPYSALYSSSLYCHLCNVLQSITITVIINTIQHNTICLRSPPTYDGAEVVHIDDGVAGARGQEAVQLRCRAVVMMPPQRVDDLVMLLDAAQQLQTRSLIHLNTPAADSVRSDVFKKGPNVSWSDFSDWITRRCRQSADSEPQS